MKSLKTRILALVLGVVTLGIWGFAGRIASVLQDDIEEVISEQLSGQVAYVANELDQALQTRIEALKEIASAIAIEQQASPAETQRLLEERQPSLTIFRLGVLVVNSDGLIIAEHGPRPMRPRGGLLGGRNYYRELAASDKPLIGSPLVASRFSAQPIIPIAVPLHDHDGAVTAALVAPVVSSDPDLFGKLMGTKIGRTGRFLVMSPKDQVIVSATERNRIMQSVPPKAANPMLYRRLYEGFEAPAVTVNSAGIEVLGVSRKLNTTGWIVIANISTEEAFAPIKASKKQIYLGAVLISLALALVLIVVLRREMSPLEQASRAIQRMSEGLEPFAPLPLRRQDEIGRLLESFNHLVRERQRREEEIRGLNHTLEARVRERTEELVTANEQLETQIAERRRAEESVLHYADRLQLLTRRTVTMLEAERKRLARELHDSVSSNLTAIRLELETIQKQLSEGDLAGLGDRLADCMGLADDAAITSREISSDLHPAVLDYMGIVPALKDLGEKFSKRTHIAVAVDGVNPDTGLHADTQIALYRIAQEALMNCAKHSGASKVAIALHCDAERIRLSIADDGVGFEPPALARHGKPLGLGLLSMQERAQAVGGRCWIESTSGKETRVIVEVSA